MYNNVIMDCVTSSIIEFDKHYMLLFRIMILCFFLRRIVVFYADHTIGHRYWNWMLYINILFHALFVSHSHTLFIL